MITTGKRVQCNQHTAQKAMGILLVAREITPIVTGKPAICNNKCYCKALALVIVAEFYFFRSSKLSGVAGSKISMTSK